MNKVIVVIMLITLHYQLRPRWEIILTVIIQYIQSTPLAYIPARTEFTDKHSLTYKHVTEKKFFSTCITHQIIFFEIYILWASYRTLDNATKIKHRTLLKFFA